MDTVSVQGDATAVAPIEKACKQDRCDAKKIEKKGGTLEGGGGGGPKHKGG